MSLTPSTRFKVGVDKSEITYIAGQNKNLSYQDVVNIIQNILREVLSSTILDLELWIDNFVPKRTGQLRDNLKANLRSSQVQGFLLRLILGTNIDYAERVNQMSTAQVRHLSTPYERSGDWAYAYYYGNYGRITLDDPRAIGNFFTHMLEFAKERIMVNLTKAKAMYVGSTPMTTGQMSKVRMRR